MIYKNISAIAKTHNPCQGYVLFFKGTEISVWGSGCMDQKKTENWTELDRLGPDRQLRLPAFQNKKTTKKPVTIAISCNQL